MTAFKEIRIGAYVLRFWPSDNGWICGITPEMMDAIEQAEKQEPVAVVSVTRLSEMFQDTNTDKNQWGHHWANGWNAALRQAMDYATPPAAQQEPVAWAEEIIADLHACYDSEMIKENDSGDELIRLDAAIACVEEAAERHTAPPAAQRQPLTEIAEALRRYGLTLVQTTKGYDVMRLGEISAHGIGGKHD